MKKVTLSFRLFSSAALLFLCALASCVDEKYDLSKDIDMTIGVGKGVSIPVGSTEKIMLTELIDDTDSDLVYIDQEGDYSISKAGSFSPESFDVGELEVHVSPVSQSMHYDFNLIDFAGDYNNLPLWMQEEIKKYKYPYVVRQQIDCETTFKIDQSVPEELVRLRYLSFKNNAKMSVRVKISSSDYQSAEMLRTIERLHLGTADKGDFVIDVPEYMVFADKSIVQGRLSVKGDAVYDNSTNSIEYVCEYDIEALDFSKYKDGFLPVVDSRISIDETFNAGGYVESDTVFFGYQNLSRIQSVDVEIQFAIDEMSIEGVEGVFAPEIEPIKECVDLDLGDELEFLENAYLDFNDPRIYVTFVNPVEARLIAEAEFVGYDKWGSVIEDSRVAASMTFEGGIANNILLDRYATQLQGYTTVRVPELNNLLKTLPDRIDVNVNARMDDGSYSYMELGKEFGISGNYEVSIPLVFDEFNLAYTETIENILGDDASDITDRIKDVESVTVNFVVLNTIPAEMTASVIAYDEYGNRLNNITARVEGVVQPGNGMDGHEVTEPVESAVSINLSSLNGELERLDDIDIIIEGKGSGKFNANEYIQLLNIALTIDENLSVDLN